MMKALWLFAAVVVVWALPITGQAQEQNVDEEEERDNYVTCNLSGDPELSTFTFQRGTVPFPCYSHLADLKLEFKENSSAEEKGYNFIIVDVFASAGIEPHNGRYFVDAVTIEIGGYAYTNEPNTHDTVAKGTYKTSSNNVETFLNSGQTSQDEANIWDIDSTFPADVILTGYDTAEKWAFLKLLRKNNPPLQIGFRPRNKSEGIPQTPRPGLFIQARRGPLKGQSDARFPKTLCSTKNDDRTFKEIKAERKYNNKLENNRGLMLYTVYTQAVEKDMDQTESKCVDAVNAFKNCIGETKRQQAVNTCSHLTTAKKVKCLERSELEPGNALVAFTKCVNVCCDVEKASSQTWLDEAGMTCPIILDNNP